jgi:hypothetical protein
MMAENLGSSTAKKEFLNMVKCQVPTILPMPSFKELANMVAAPGLTPRRSHRIAKAGVEFHMGDMSRRSTKKAMRNLGVIGENENIDHQVQEEYARLFSEPLSDIHIVALAALFGWKSLNEQNVDRVVVALTT